MSTYTKTTNFTAKDNLTSGDPAKVIKGSEFDTEFNAIETAVNSKADKNNGVHTGTTTISTANIDTLQIDSVAVTATAAEINTLDGITASTAELNKLDGYTGDVTDLNKLAGVTATSTELNLLDGVTATTTELNILDGVTSTTAEINKLDGFTGTVDDLNYAKDLRATGVTTAEFDKLDGLTATTAELNITDGLTATTAELNVLDGITATTTELNYTDGVTSNIQTQLDGKASSTASPTITLGGDLSGSATLTNLGNATLTATVADDSHNHIISNVDGLQTALDDKAPTASPTFTGTTTIPTVDINGGNIDGAVIGSSEAASGQFTTLVSNSAIIGGELDVTGTITADGLTVDGSTGITVRNDAAGANEPKLVFDNDTFAGANHAQIQTGNGGLQLLIESPSTSTFQNRHQILMNGGGGDDVTFKLSTDNGSTYKNQLKIDNNDFHLYEDTGTTAKMVWDASAETLEIGYTNDKLSVYEGFYRIKKDGSNKIFVGNTADALGSGTGMINYLYDAEPFIWYQGSERMRIDSSGNVGIGTASPWETLSIPFNEKLSFGSSTYPFSIGRSSAGELVTTIEDGYDASNTRIDFKMRAGSANENTALSITGAGNVGIGTASPSQKLEVSSGTIKAKSVYSTGNFFSAFHSAPSAGGDGGLYMGAISPNNSDISSGGYYYTGGNYIAKDTTASTINLSNSGIIFRYNSGLTAGNTYASTERARIDSSGNLLVGTTTVFEPLSSGGSGVALRPGGNVYIGSSVQPLTLNVSNDGVIANFLKDGSPVGSIGSGGSNTVYIGGGDTGLLFAPATNIISPWNTSTNLANNGNLDLGYSGGRFKDLYLSGGVYLGGTGAVNKLDDYEEGTWTPTLHRSTGGDVTATYTSQAGHYTKIGRMVFVECEIVVSSISSQGSGYAMVNGLPFTASGSAYAKIGLVTTNSFVERTINKAFASSNKVYFGEDESTGFPPEIADFNTGSTNLRFSLAYQTAS